MDTNLGIYNNLIKLRMAIKIVDCFYDAQNKVKPEDNIPKCVL